MTTETDKVYKIEVRNPEGKVICSYPNISEFGYDDNSIEATTLSGKEINIIGLGTGVFATIEER